MLSRAIGGWMNDIEGDRRMDAIPKEEEKENKEVDNNEREREGGRGK